MPANNPLLNDDVLINGCRIATGVHGSGTPLVLVHGTPAHSIIWQSLVPVFVDAGFHVHLYDLAGFGASERPLTADTSVAGQVGYLIKLLEHWQLEKQIFLVTISAGPFHSDWRSTTHPF